jgi:hypothetical protein
MNFNVMGNEGALLYDVLDCSDAREHETGIAKLLSEVRAEIIWGLQSATGFAG